MLLLYYTYVLASFLLLFLSYSFLRRSYGKQSNLPPGSSGWLPFIGQTISFISPHPSYSRGHFLEHNIQKYGKIFRSHVFGYPTIISCDAEFNSFVLNNEGKLFASSYPINIPTVLGNKNLLTATGELHKRLRSEALSLVAPSSVQNDAFLSDIEANVLRVMASWKDKQKLVFVEEAQKFTFSVIVKQILNLEMEDPAATEILKSFTTFLKGLVSLPINLPGTPYAKAIQDNRHIKAVLHRIRQQRVRRQKIEQGMDYLDVLLARNELSDEEIYSLVVDLLLAGYETTSMLLTLCAKYLGENPTALNHLKEEQLQVRKQVVDGRLGWKDYKNMQFTQCVINEALRLGNVVKFVHRKTIKPINYKGYEIPVGWKVLPILSGPHLDPSVYQDPFKFIPSRWQGPNTSIVKSFMPFGGGRKLCPGYELGRIEASFFLHHLVLNFSWTHSEDDVPTSFPYLSFVNGFPITIHTLN